MRGVLGASGVTGSVLAQAVTAHYRGENLLPAAAGVQIKKRRSRIKSARAAPQALALAGLMATGYAVAGNVLPPAPDFWLRTGSVARIINQIAARSVDLLRIAPAQAPHWEGQGRQ